MVHSWVVAQLVAVDLQPGAAFLDVLRRAWDDGDAVLPLQQEAPASQRRRTAERLGAGVYVDPGGRHDTEWGVPVSDGDAVVVATSGTTGEPKGVVHTHDSISASAFMTATALGVESDIHWLCCLPLSHVAGLSVVTRYWETGAKLTVHDGFDPAAVDDAAGRGATHVSLVPTALARMDPRPWRRILLGGSSIPEDRPPNTVAGYGMTETWGGVVYEGQALPGVGVRITDEDAGLGRIEVRTPTAMRAYRRIADAGGRGGLAGREVLEEAPFDPQGWFRTGDLGRIDPVDGRLRVEGRGDDLIVTGGEKVWPSPVEEALESHGGVAEAAVVGVADPEWGQRVMAVVVPSRADAPPTLAQLRDWVAQRLPKAAAPRELRLVEQLPRTSLGKLRRSTIWHDGGEG